MSRKFQPMWLNRRATSRYGCILLFRRGFISNILVVSNRISSRSDDVTFIPGHFGQTSYTGGTFHSLVAHLLASPPDNQRWVSYLHGFSRFHKRFSRRARATKFITSRRCVRTSIIWLYWAFLRTFYSTFDLMGVFVHWIAPFHFFVSVMLNFTSFFSNIMFFFSFINAARVMYFA